MSATASIVIYQQKADEISDLLNTLLHSCILRTYIIDNSPLDGISEYFKDPRITYIHNPSNPGFGAAHNIAIDLSIKAGNIYHFVINPDIQLSDGVIEKMFSYMESNADIGMMMPKILNPDNSIQFLPKLLPSPFNILLRKLKWPKPTYRKFIRKYEFQFVDESVSYNSPIVSGCFTMLRLEAIKQVGAYDDIFFMYFEDWDLSRRIHMHYKTLYFADVSVFHKYEAGARKKIRLFVTFIKSAVLYFNKWGWFFDQERKHINKVSLNQFEKSKS